MVNKITLIGNLGQDPEVKVLESGTKVARFSLATNENYRDKNNQWQTITEWHNVVAWRFNADRAERLKKGDQVFVEGKVSYRKYMKDNIERYSTDIVAREIRQLGRLRSQDDESYNQAEGNETDTSGMDPFDKTISVPSSSTDDDDTDGEVGDDLPF